jgi:predicted dehydrogenase
VFDKCDYRLDLEGTEGLREMYLEAEDADGYYRDRCVFDADITIEDTMQVEAEYANGVFLNYTLCAYSPWEGLEITFQGTKGDLTHKHIEVHGVFSGQHRERDGEGAESFTTTLHLAGGLPQRVEVEYGKGAHGGADPVMLGYIFDAANMPPDKYGRSSTEKDGAWSILTGIAANKAIATSSKVKVADMLAEAGIELER